MAAVKIFFPQMSFLKKGCVYKEISHPRQKPGVQLIFPSALLIQMLRHKAELYVAEMCDGVPSPQPASKGEA